MAAALKLKTINKICVWFDLAAICYSWILVYLLLNTGETSLISAGKNYSQAYIAFSGRLCKIKGQEEIGTHQHTAMAGIRELQS